jgi:MFS family permease
MNEIITPTPAAPAEAKRQGRRATIGSYLGTTVEYYDFLLYGTASALVFPAVFFADIPPAAGVVLSYLTLAAGYVARPVGGILFGHFGDKYGRKQMLVVTMLIMGVASMAIGLVPGSAQIGVAAPVILVSLRVIQGIAVGGELAGASLMAMEHGTVARRGFIGSIVASGGPSGAVLATLMFGLVSLLPGDQLLAWGWRIPFLLSAVLVVIGLVLRVGVTESPEFLASEAGAHKRTRVPIVDTLASNWRSVVVCIVAALAPFFVQSLMATFALTYAVQSGTPQSLVLWIVTLANFVNIFTLMFYARLSDTFGRRRIMLIGYLLTAVSIWGVFALLSSSVGWLVLVAYLISNPISQAFMYGPLSAFMAEMFPTRNRYTGMSLSFQLATTIASGFAPLVAAALLTAAGSTVPITALVSALCVAGALSLVLGRRIHTRSVGAAS